MNSVCFLPTPERIPDPKVPCYGLNDMDEKHGNGYTSRRSAQQYKEVSEDLSKDIRAILRYYLDDKKN